MAIMATADSAFQVLHTKRLNDATARTEDAADLIKNLRQGNMLFATPYGSNDDWYWIYAAIKAGEVISSFP
jgi:proteinaceous RNase P